jgi:hypothetical protein
MICLNLERLYQALINSKKECLMLNKYGQAALRAVELIRKKDILEPRQLLVSI